ncbi:hypothetical protein GCM10017783_24910 [Deinococcus piscis]|uniref:PRTRC system protein B n=1 Tax=Deinococcus piscis TaxID=394230 RepID=A0ABQ3KBG6_9DEIO|nr:hypothetical protein [Deinococcus piscis]GHG11604.1 hypothetical protein GCM10017783_24910 [Deinococcus piscis]
MELNLATPFSELHACKAIIVYGTSDRQLNMTCQHDILVGEQGAVLGPGQQVTEELIENLRNMNGLRRERLILLPPEVIAISGKHVAWTVPGRVRPMALHSNDRAVQAFDGVPLPQPHLLFIAGPGTLHIYALASSERPQSDTPLYRAPYMNIFSSSQMCRGNVPLPAEPDVSRLRDYEDLFFLSNSTGGNVFLPPTIPSYGRLLELCHERGHFDTQWLVPTRQTLGDVIQGGVQ